MRLDRDVFSHAGGCFGCENTYLFRVLHYARRPSRVELRSQIFEFIIKPGIEFYKDDRNYILELLCGNLVISFKMCIINYYIH